MNKRAVHESLMSYLCRSATMTMFDTTDEQICDYENMASLRINQIRELNTHSYIKMKMNQQKALTTSAGASDMNR